MASTSKHQANTSLVWNYFKILSTDVTKVICNVCTEMTILSRGGKTAKTFTTSPLTNHLKNKHPDEFKKMTELKGKGKRPIEPATEFEPTSEQTFKRPQTMMQCFEKTLLWDVNSDKSKQLHYAIGEMIALDNQPFLVVENPGFQKVMKIAAPRYKVPGRKYFSNNIIPDIYDKVQKRIEELLNISNTPISLTSDAWTCSKTNESFLSLSGHLLTEDFQYISVVLAAQHFPGHHTGDNISDTITNMLKKWKIEKKNVHVMLRDNAANMICGCDTSGLNHESCFIHTLQLVIRDALFTQRSINDLVAKCRSIVTHFKHSCLACGKLKTIQLELGLPINKLIQDVKTRFNSTYLMLVRLNEQKRAISVYCSDEDNGLNALSAHQWNLMENVIRILQPLHDLTLEASHDKASISMVIPAVKTLICYLGKEHNDSGVQTMKKEMKEKTENRFFFQAGRDSTKNIANRKMYVIATVLDPRYKLAFIEDKKHSEAKEWILEEITKHQESTQIADVPVQVLSELTPEPISLRSEIVEDMWDCFSELVTNSTEKRIASHNITSNEEAELNTYLSCGLLPKKEDPLLWWKQNRKSYPLLAKVARQFLAAPASSVYSERMFSEAGTIYDDERSRLLPRNAEMLLFLNFNLPLLHKLSISYYM